MDPMRPNDRRYSVRRILTGCALCCLSTGTLSAIVLLVLFRVLLGDCNITCDEKTEGAEQTDTGDYVCDGACLVQDSACLLMADAFTSCRSPLLSG